jgi:hypothetical protein
MPQDLGATPPPIASPGHPGAPGEPVRASVGHIGRSAGRESDRASAQRERPSGRALPCQPCNNSIEERVKFPAAVLRTAYALQVNVEAAVERWSLERTGFLTLTFADHVTCPREAQRRMNSLSTNVLKPRYGEAIRVIERQESGRIHYHLLVRVGADIRTAFDFAAVKKKDYRSASLALRSEWAFWRRTAKLYGFGRTEMLPIISTAAAVGRYVGKYISKHFQAREERDKGVRLVSYIGPRVATVKFAWAGPRGVIWRRGLEALVRALAAAGQIDAPSTEAMRRRYGRRWAWDWRDTICPGTEGAESGESVDKQTGEIYGEADEAADDIAACDASGFSGLSLPHGGFFEDTVRSDFAGAESSVCVDRRDELELPEVFASRGEGEIAGGSETRSVVHRATSTYVESVRGEWVEPCRIEAEQNPPTS